MRIWVSLAIVGLSLSGCVSTEMKPMIGHPIQDALIKYGAPEQIIDMPDGAKAYQFRQAGGAAFVPGATRTTPGVAVALDGCLLTFIAKPEADGLVVRDIVVPKGLTC
jgi:hypothetical protein